MAESTELFKAIGEAYLCLRDPDKRAAYDHDLSASPCSASALDLGHSLREDSDVLLEGY